MRIVERNKKRTAQTKENAFVDTVVTQNFCFIAEKILRSLGDWKNVVLSL